MRLDHASLNVLGLMFAFSLLHLVATPAQAALGDVLYSIPCAGSNTGDIAWVDGFLYQVIFSPTAQRNIYKVDPLNGAVLDTIPYAGTSPQGLTYDGAHLWQSDVAGEHRVYELDPATGAVLSSFVAPGASPQALGLGWDGASLWLADSRSPETIWELDRMGVVLGQFPAPGTSPYGLAWGAGFIWVSDNAVGGIAPIYKIDPSNGAILASFTCPDNGGSPNGIAHDGEYLWIAVNTTDRIYKVDDGIGPTPVGESTWGGIKAIF